MSDNQIFSYTHRDYESARKEGLSQIPTLSNGEWTDLNATDPGIIILDYVHALVDMMQYYQDHQAQEAFINTATERTNLFRLANQLSYKIRSATSAKVYVTFHTDLVLSETIKIPKYTRVATKSEIQFVTLEDAYLKAGEADVVVECAQGVILTKTYEGSGLSAKVSAEEGVNQSVTLTADTVDTEFITITDNLGRTWSQVDFITFSTDIDRVYEVSLNPDNSVTIKFGDGTRGIAPKETDVLTITYLLTDADKGKVGANTIINLLDEILDSSGKYVNLKVNNEEDSVGGATAQSSTSIRKLAPGAIKAQGRAVTLSDFENLAKLVDGVSEAKAYDVNINPNIPYQVVKVFIIPDDYSASTNLLVNKVYDYLYARMIPPTTLQVSLPSGITTDVNIVVKAFDNTDKAALEYEIRNMVIDYFDALSREIGEDFYSSDLSATISNIPNVRYVVSLTPSGIVTIEDMAVAKLGTLNVEVQ